MERRVAKNGEAKRCGINDISVNNILQFKNQHKVTRLCYKI